VEGDISKTAPEGSDVKSEAAAQGRLDAQQEPGLAAGAIPSTPNIVAQAPGAPTSGNIVVTAMNAPVVPDGDVVGRPTEFIVVLDRALDPHSRRSRPEAATRRAPADRLEGDACRHPGSLDLVDSLLAQRPFCHPYWVPISGEGSRLPSPV
jgi:hypothetical protein